MWLGCLPRAELHCQYCVIHLTSLAASIKLELKIFKLLHQTKHLSLPGAEFLNLIWYSSGEFFPKKNAEKCTSWLWTALLFYGWNFAVNDFKLQLRSIVLVHYFDTEVNQTTYLLGTRTSRPGKLRVIGALCCGRVNWEPLHPVLQKLHAVVSPPANPKRYSRDGTASECNASTGCSKNTWRRHRRTPRDGHPGCGNSSCARERRHRCEDIQNNKQTAVLRDCVANARKTGPRWDAYPRLSIWEPHLRCCSTRRFWETLRELRSLTTSIDFGTSFDAFVPRTEIWVLQLKSSSMSHVAGEVFWSPSYIKSHTHWKHWASNGLKFSSTSICSKHASIFTQDNI